MCEYCHREYCCLHGYHRYRPCHGPYPPFPVETVRELPEDERDRLERRIQSLEARLSALEK